MTYLEDYLKDGANYQARAVLMFLQGNTNIEESWNSQEYEAKIKVARWENCREQGYIVSLRTSDFRKQINIAFFEHRNSNRIHAVEWEQTSINTLTIDTAKFGEIYKDKYDTSFSVDWREAFKMADWVTERLIEFWVNNSK